MKFDPQPEEQHRLCMRAGCWETY